MNKYCPNCESSNFKHHNLKYYDPGYKYECHDCDHCFDTPSTQSDEDEKILEGVAI